VKNRRLQKTAYEKVHNFYSSPDIIRMIESRWIGWVEHVARTGENFTKKVLAGSPERIKPL
jgi:hypothetical protein